MPVPEQVVAEITSQLHSLEHQEKKLRRDEDEVLLMVDCEELWSRGLEIFPISNDEVYLFSNAKRKEIKYHELSKEERDEFYAATYVWY